MDYQNYLFTQRRTQGINAHALVFFCAHADTKILVFGSAGNSSGFWVPQITQCEKVIKWSIPFKLVFLFEVNSAQSLLLLLFWSKLFAVFLDNLSDNKMVPQYCSYGSAGMPAVPVTIFMSVNMTLSTCNSLHIKLKMSL